MPQLGETVTEGTITKWLKQVGDSVAEDDVLFEVSTDKVDSEVPSPVTGFISEILVAEGETVDVGTKLAVISAEAPGSDPVAPPAEVPVAAEPEPQPVAAAPASTARISRCRSGRASHSTRTSGSRRRLTQRPRNRPVGPRPRPPSRGARPGCATGGIMVRPPGSGRRRLRLP